ncbi:DUF1769-domain-containing protein [Suhomyces tanzawaensis NRRL Y-17324]|uniref:DUF1769-domain-containing protein n=1 Tax=Suhomyces tanzawaensis NRRL Y-17324 TaxID=984487 RepID=A0A1E4SK82_9ASCO|nr:DUF1769-domain-containing protein [Suhomyces tanzawaensis NRRL Y-17324]ODV79925.1 DUF1769-domain-containing protein [Suhomyces tanzawaensis NRRL Y-17324]
MPIVKRLHIKASNNYESGFKIVPVNTNRPVVIESDLGTISLCINIKNFDGSTPHLSNSLYNVGDKVFLDGEAIDSSVEDSDELVKSVLPNLRLEIKFLPKVPIKGSELLFGNDFLVPIKEYVPTTLLSTGLKFFTWFINKTVKGDIYGDKPFLYGAALSSITSIAVDKNPNDALKVVDPPKKAPTDLVNFKENLKDNGDGLDVPEDSFARKKFFGDIKNCDKFTYNHNHSYLLQFDTTSVKMADSKYAVTIPTYGSKTFDFDVSSYANDHLNNFNWTLKRGGYEGVGHGVLALVVNFSLLDEEAKTGSG